MVSSERVDRDVKLGPWQMPWEHPPQLGPGWSSCSWTSCCGGGVDMRSHYAVEPTDRTVSPLLARLAPGQGRQTVIMRAR